MSFTHKDLPQWLQKVTPQETKDTIIKYDENESIFYIDDEKMTTFKNIESVYDYVKNHRMHFIFDESVITWCENTKDNHEENSYSEDTAEEVFQQTSHLRKLQDIFYKKYGYRSINKMITYKNSDDTYSAMFENSSKGNIVETVLDIKYFEEVTAKAYHDHPKNFMYSYNFINQHPMFWLMKKMTDGKIFWIDDAGVEGLSIYFYNEDENDDNSPVLCVIETGEHVEPEYTSRYFSPLLTIRASTYEQAIIKCAARLARFYKDDGTAKDDYQEKANQATDEYIDGKYSIDD